MTKKLSTLMTAVAVLPLALTQPAQATMLDIHKSAPAQSAAQNAEKYALHLTLNYRLTNGSEVEATFGLTEDVHLAAQKMLVGNLNTVSTEDFSNWLFLNGGKLDRRDAPAWIEINTDGTRTEKYYTDGALMRDRIFADLTRIPNVTVTPTPQP